MLMIAMIHTRAICSPLACLPIGENCDCTSIAPATGMPLPSVGFIGV